MTELLEQAIALVQQLPESEQDSIAAMIFQEVEKAIACDDLGQLLQDCQVSTGISDLSYQHDYYIHGTPKREIE